MPERKEGKAIPTSLLVTYMVMLDTLFIGYYLHCFAEKKSGGNPEDKKPASNTNGEANGRKKG